MSDASDWCCVSCGDPFGVGDVFHLSGGLTCHDTAVCIGDALAELARLRAQNEALRESVCGTCGRSLAPDGDCYGCESDRLTARVAELEKALSKIARRGKVFDAKGTWSEKASQIARAALAEQGEDTP